MKRIALFLITASFLFLSCESSAQRRWFSHEVRRTPINLFYDDEEEVEDTIHGLSFGLNLGGYFAGRATGNFYNGSGPIDGYVNDALGTRLFSIEERIDPYAAIGTNFYNDVRAIMQEYPNYSGYTIPYDTHPTNMYYNPSLSIGFQLKYNFNRYSALVFNANFIKLKAISQFTINFTGPNTQGSLTNTQLFTIAGDEQRFNFNLGYRVGWMMGDYSNIYFQFGGSMLGTKFVDNYLIVVPNTKLQLLTQSLAIGQQSQSSQSQTGIGFGGYSALGLEFWMGKYSFDLSFGFSRDKVVLFSYEKTVWNKLLQASFTL